MGELTKGAQVVRVIFIIFNILFLLVGLAILAVGIWLIVVGEDLEFVTGSTYASGAALIIASGVITIVVTAIGFVGAIGKWRPVLGIFVGLLVVIIILEIAAGIVGFVFRNNIRDEIPDRMRDAISQFSPGEAENLATAFVNFVQTSFDCCGVDNYTDWLSSNYSCTSCELPPTCQCVAEDEGCLETNTYPLQCTQTTCSPDNRTFSARTWMEGCLESTDNTISIIGYSVGGVGIAFGIFELIGILTALGLICCISHSRKQTVV